MFMKEISVVGDSKFDVVNFFVGATRTEEIYMTNVSSMVIRTIAQADGDKISRLTIIDHGNPDGGWFGADYVNNGSFSSFEPHLAKLFPHFEKKGIVQLGHCEIGKNEDLLRLFAKTFGVAVYAGTGKQNNIYRFNWGEYVRCSPRGTIYHNVYRP
jgi:hypothetical protein